MNTVLIIDPLQKFVRKYLKTMPKPQTKLFAIENQSLQRLVTSTAEQQIHF